MFEPVLQNRAFGSAFREGSGEGNPLPRKLRKAPVPKYFSGYADADMSGLLSNALDQQEGGSFCGVATAVNVEVGPPTTPPTLCHITAAKHVPFFCSE